MSGTPSLKLLLDLYQKCKARGEWASLFLVTKDGKDLTFTKDAPNKKDSSDSLSALIVEPKDEINLEEPEVKEDDKIWEKLEYNFKEGVKEFTDGSTCNEKILIFWGKCSFKEGFDRSYLLNKKNWPQEIKASNTVQTKSIYTIYV